jgi:DNA gyrase inhibitor GyrI
MAVEEPPFQVVLHDGVFEIRDYPALVVAEVTVEGDQKQAASRGFRLLAGYIFGGNRSRASIAMTAPVAQTPTGEKIAMTAPVTQTPSSSARADPRAEQWVVRFTMPHAYTLEALPVPDDPRVHLQRLPPSRFAVVRFSGLAGKPDVDAKTSALIAWAGKHHLQPIGPASLAQYDPPWTLWFARRNEVMIPIAS